jgi:hypothetical protein
MEIAKPGSSSWMPYAPEGAKELDDVSLYRPGQTLRFPGY